MRGRADDIALLSELAGIACGSLRQKLSQVLRVDRVPGTPKLVGGPPPMLDDAASLEVGPARRVDLRVDHPREEVVLCLVIRGALEGEPRPSDPHRVTDVVDDDAGLLAQLATRCLDEVLALFDSPSWGEPPGTELWSGDVATAEQQRAPLRVHQDHPGCDPHDERVLARVVEHCAILHRAI